MIRTYTFNGSVYQLLSEPVPITITQEAFLRCPVVRGVIGNDGRKALALGIASSGNGQGNGSGDKLLITAIHERKLPDIKQLFRLGRLCAIGVTRTELKEEDLGELFAHAKKVPSHRAMQA